MDTTNISALIELPKMPIAALSIHLAGGAELRETLHLDGVMSINAVGDDPDYWNIEEPDPADLAMLQAKLEVGQLPEFINVSLL